MSAIASFSLFQKNDFNEYVATAGVPLETLTRAAMAKHPMMRFREKKLIPLAEYQWSGYVMAFEMPAFLKSRSIVLSNYDLKQQSEQLGQAIGQPVNVFGNPKAKQLLPLLEQVLDEKNVIGAIEKFLKKYPKKELRTSDNLSGQAVFDAILILRYWLNRISKTQYGVLEVSV